MVEIITRSEDETRAVARRLAARLRSGDVIALEGPLGAGKTCFVRGLAEGLGLDPHEVSSPTFVICQEYEPRVAAGKMGAEEAGEEGGEGRRANRKGPDLTLFHLDGYRIGCLEDLETVGWEELLRSDDAVIAVEWADRLGAALPEARLGVVLAHIDETSRVIALSAPPQMEDRLELVRSAASAIDEGAAAPCPICRKRVAPTSETFPFCSSRCRLVDLGRWFDEGYRVSRQASADDELG